MKKIEWRRMDAKVDPGDKKEPVLLLIYQNWPCAREEQVIGIPLGGRDVWHLIKLLIRSWFAHLRLKWDRD